MSREDQREPISPVEKMLSRMIEDDPNNPSFHLGRAFYVEEGGEIDLQLLSLAWKNIATINSMCQVFYEYYCGGLYRKSTFSPMEIDVRHCSADELDNEVKELLQKPFDINTWPLCSLSVIIVNTRIKVLVTKVSHMIADGYSAAVFYKQFSIVYATMYYAKNILFSTPFVLSFFGSCALGILSLLYQNQPYTDIINQRSRGLTPEKYDEIRRHYKLAAEGTNQAIKRPENNNLSGNAAASPTEVWVHTCALPDNYITALQNLSETKRASVSRILMATYQLTLYRLDQNPARLIRTLNSGRSKSSECSIGYFAFSEAIRSEVKPDDTFSDLLDRAGENLRMTKMLSPYPVDAILKEISISPPSNEFNFVQGKIEFGLPGIKFETGQGIQDESVQHGWYCESAYHVKHSLYINAQSSTEYFVQLTLAKDTFSEKYGAIFFQEFLNTIVLVYMNPNVSLQSLPKSCDQ